MSTMNSEENSAGLRLQIYLRDAGVASRRHCEELITAGQVRVNGQVVTQLGTKVDPHADVVEVDGRVVRAFEERVVVALNKPAGVVTTMKDQFGRPCVADLVPCDRYPGLFPIGRLDADTTGLLLFSTDGDMGKLAHPSFHVTKRYLACVEGRPSARDLEQLEHGILIDDVMTVPAEARILPPDEEARAKQVMTMPKDLVRGGSRVYSEILKERRQKRSVVELSIHEGRYHQVKKMLKAVGHPVVALHRAAVGPIELGDLARGEWRLLTDDEVSALRAGL